jgi:alpha-glucosidase
VSDEPTPPATPWWDRAVGYEVYVRSFQDSDGDGVGDLEGIRRRLPYLADLGVDLVWITPFYPSPQADHGYDVADYTDVDPRFGDLDTFDALVADAHALGLRVACDLVPNHTSSQHPWFQAALAGDPRYRDYYVWRDPGPDGGPPNNWVSHFGGPAWTFHEPSRQYYMHLFLPEQPDLDWRNEAVRDEFDAILRFWFGRGVDGLRIDVAHTLIEDAQYRDNPLRGEPPPPGADPSTVFEAYRHDHDQDQPGILDILRRWNRVAADYDALLIGEVYLLQPERLTRYVAGRDALHTTFCFPALRVGWDAREMRTTLRACVEAGEGLLSWPLSSHDDPHAATRFGGGAAGTRRAQAYLTLLAALPGFPFLFQGDELGLPNGDIDVAADPLAVRNAGGPGRDGSRTPMPWEPGPNLGFTTGEPWLPLGANRTEAVTVAAQQRDPRSPLQRTRALLAARRALPRTGPDEPVVWLAPDDEALVAVRYGEVIAALNTAGTDARLALPDGDWAVAHASADGARLADGTALHLPGDAAAILARHARSAPVGDAASGVMPGR